MMEVKKWLWTDSRTHSLVFFSTWCCAMSLTHREGTCCRHWAKTAALWCAVCRRGPEPGVGLWRGPGLICQSQGLRQGHQGDADQRRRKRRNEREVAAASSAAPGTADAGAAGSAAACWWLYVQPRRKKRGTVTMTHLKKQCWAMRARKAED